MRASNRIVALLYLFLLLFLSGCQPGATPEQIADKFWAGAVKNNSVVMRRLCSKQTYDSGDDFSLLHNTTSYTLGKIVIDGQQAEIDTTLHSDEANQPFHIKTYLLKENDVWLVDYQRTVAFFNLNREMTDLMGDIEEMAEEFANQVEGSVEEFRKKAVPKIKSGIEQAEKELKQKLPEIKQKIQEFLDELERSIEESIPEEEPTTTRT